MNMHLKYWASFIVLALCCNIEFLSAQSTNTETDLSDPLVHLEYYKNSPLIIRLNMKQNTLNAYKRQMDIATSVENKTSFEENYEELKKERAYYKKCIVSAFKEHYDISSVYFIHDHDYKDFKSGKLGLLFDSEEKEVYLDPDAQYFLLVQGENDLHWIVNSSVGIKFPNAFPREYKPGFKRVLNFITSQKDVNQEDMDKVAMVMTERFEKYEFKLKKKRK